MKVLQGILLSTLFLAFGMASVNAQIAAAELKLVSEDGMYEFSQTESATNRILLEINPHFEMRNAAGETMEDIKVLGGEVFSFNGELKEKVGAITELGEFDEASKVYFETVKNIRIDVTLSIQTTESELPKSIDYSFYLNVGPPSLFLGEFGNGSTPSLTKVVNIEKLELYNLEIPTLLNYTMLSGIITVEDVKETGGILANGVLDENAKNILTQSQGKQVTILMNYVDAISGKKKRTALVFNVKG